MEHVPEVRQKVYAIVVDAGIPLPTMSQPWRNVRFDIFTGAIYTRKPENYHQWKDSSDDVYDGPTRILKLKE